MRRISCMKTTAVLFLFTLLLAGVAGAAEERLIPFDDFYIHVGINEQAGPASDKLRVMVRLEKSSRMPQGSTVIEVSCPDFASQNKTLEITEVADFLAACKAAANGQEYHKVVRTGFDKTVYEVVKVSDRTRVSVLRGRQVIFAPEDGARLKEALAKALLAEEWYRLLLRERTLPAKTAEARPPKAASIYLRSKVGAVPCDGLTYEMSLTNFGRTTDLHEFVMHGLRFGRGSGSSSGVWVKSLLEQVALALQAAEKNAAFAFESPPTGTQEASFAVKANLMTHRADVSLAPGKFFGKNSQVEGSFGVEELAAIRELAEQGEARAKWFKEHEAWFFESE